MSPIDAAIIRRKLQRIAACLDGLRPIARLSLEEYRARFYERKATERLLQEAIEAALDVNAHLIAELGGEVPEEYELSSACGAQGDAHSRRGAAEAANRGSRLCGLVRAEAAG